MLLLCKKFIIAGSGGNYTPGQVLVNSDSGSVPSSINLLDDGVYELRLVGGGGGVNNYFGVATGGSGGGFVGTVRLTKGTYSITWGKKGGNVTSSTGRAGSGGSSVFGGASVGGGQGGATGYAGAGGAKPTMPYTIVSSSVNRAGNAGGTYNVGGGAGGASIYSGYGKGCGYTNVGGYSNATNGLVYLAFVSD